MDSIDKAAVPDILVIGDSFHWRLFNIIEINNLFGRHQFWYRNHSIYPRRNADGVKTATKKTAIESLDKFDFIFIVVTSIAMDEAGWQYFKRIEKELE